MRTLLTRPLKDVQMRPIDARMPRIRPYSDRISVASIRVKAVTGVLRDRFSAGPSHSSWHRKARKKQVAMIAQKVVDANQPEK